MERLGSGNTFVSVVLENSYFQHGKTIVNQPRKKDMEISKETFLWLHGKIDEKFKAILDEKGEPYPDPKKRTLYHGIGDKDRKEGFKRSWSNLYGCFYLYLSSNERLWPELSEEIQEQLETYDGPARRLYQLYLFFTRGEKEGDKYIIPEYETLSDDFLIIYKAFLNSSELWEAFLKRVEEDRIKRDQRRTIDDQLIDQSGQKLDIPAFNMDSPGLECYRCFLKDRTEEIETCIVVIDFSKEKTGSSDKFPAYIPFAPSGAAYNGFLESRNAGGFVVLDLRTRDGRPAQMILSKGLDGEFKNSELALGATVNYSAGYQTPYAGPIAFLKISQSKKREILKLIKQKKIPLPGKIPDQIRLYFKKHKGIKIEGRHCFTLEKLGEFLSLEKNRAEILRNYEGKYRGYTLNVGRREISRSCFEVFPDGRLEARTIGGTLYNGRVEIAKVNGIVMFSLKSTIDETRYQILLSKPTNPREKNLVLKGVYSGVSSGDPSAGRIFLRRTNEEFETMSLEFREILSEFGQDQELYEELIGFFSGREDLYVDDVNIINPRHLPFPEKWDDLSVHEGVYEAYYLSSRSKGKIVKQRPLRITKDGIVNMKSFDLDEENNILHHGKAFSYGHTLYVHTYRGNYSEYVGVMMFYVERESGSRTLLGIYAIPSTAGSNPVAGRMVLVKSKRHFEELMPKNYSLDNRKDYDLLNNNPRHTNLGKFLTGKTNNYIKSKRETEINDFAEVRYESYGHLYFTSACYYASVLDDGKQTLHNFRQAFIHGFGNFPGDYAWLERELYSAGGSLADKGYSKELRAIASEFGKGEAKTKNEYP